jgi:hypothetical protein
VTADAIGAFLAVAVHTLAMLAVAGVDPVSTAPLLAAIEAALWRDGRLPAAAGNEPALPVYD